MGLKQLFCVDMDPRAVPEMYLCPKLEGNQLMGQAVRYVKVGGELPEGRIADGAQLTVAPGQCLLLTAGGEIQDVCAQPGVYLYQEDAPASFLMGKLTRFRAPEPKDCGAAEQAVYLNTEEFGNNAFNLGQKISFPSDEGGQVSLMCRGRYCYRIANPILFYNYIQSHFGQTVDRTAIDQWLMEQFLMTVPQVYERLAAMGATDGTLSEYTPELMSTFRAMLYDKWYTACGIELQRVSVTTTTIGSGRFDPFGGVTVQAEQEEGAPDAQMEKAAKEFFGSMLSALGSAFKTAGGDGGAASPAQNDQASEENNDNG